MKSILGLMILATFSNAFGKELTYKQLKRIYNKAVSIDNNLFKLKVQDKTFKCYEKFSDSTGGDEYKRFVSVNSGITERFSQNLFTFKSTLTGKRGTINGDVQMYVRLASDDSLIIFDDSGYTNHYVYCPQESLSQGESETVLAQLDGKINAFAPLKKGFVAIVENGKETQLIIYDSKFNILRTSTANELNAKAGLSKQFQSFPPNVQLNVLGDEIYLYGSFYPKSDYRSKNLIQKFKADLIDVELIELANIDGHMEIDSNGNFNFFHFNNLDRSATAIETYNLKGDLLNQLSLPEMRDSTSFMGTATKDGYAVVSYCDMDFQKLYGCPNKDVNYTGLSLVDRNGKFLKFISEFDKYEKIDSANILWTKATDDGGILVAWARVFGQPQIATIFKYDRHGNYVNSWGIDAKNKLNTNIGVIENFQKDMFKLYGNDLFYFEGSLVFKITL